MNPHIQRLVFKAHHLRREMWRHTNEETTKLKNLGFATARVLAITFGNLKEHRIFARAAALSFSSLLGLGPMIALMVLVSGFVLDKSEPGSAQQTIERIVTYIAPQVTLQDPGETVGETDLLGEMISNFIAASQSSTVGVGGTLILILIVIQLFTSIEDAFNDIWGVSKGRKLISRVVLYWTVISLGTVLIFAGIAFAVSELMQLNAKLASFTEGMPGSETVNSWVSTYGGKLISFVAAVVMLSFFYRFIPNTQVEWKAAATGAFFSVTCIILNNSMAFLYIERVAMQRTLYGSLALLPILMIGLLTFWLCLLFGGRLSFAVQNARFKSGRVAWDELSTVSKESLCLLLFAQIARRFQECGEAYSNLELAKQHNLPSPLTGAALDHLTELGLAANMPAKNDDISNAARYLPARPLEKISLLEYKQLFESYGEKPDDDLFATRDPLVAHYHELIRQARSGSFGKLTLDQALKEQKF